MKDEKIHKTKLMQDKNKQMCVSNSIHLCLHPELKDDEKKKYVYNKDKIFTNGSKNK
jgi:hypothetical protein